MKTGIMYEIIRDGKRGAIAPFGEPLETDIVTGTKTMLIADEGKTLIKDGEEVGQAIWLRDDDDQAHYIEEIQDENTTIEDI